MNPGICLFSYAGYSPRPPTSSDRNETLRGGWPSGHSSEVQISSKSVSELWRSKFALCRWFGQISGKTAKWVGKRCCRHGYKLNDAWSNYVVRPILTVVRDGYGARYNSKTSTVESVVNLVRSHIYHARRPPLFTERLTWCSASRGFVSDSWYLLRYMELLSKIANFSYFTCIWRPRWGSPPLEFHANL